jgi:hypothetical protein
LVPKGHKFRFPVTSSRPFDLTKSYSGVKIKEDEMGGAHSMSGPAHKFILLGGGTRRKGKLGAKDRMVLKLHNEQDVMDWSGLA